MAEPTRSRIVVGVDGSPSSVDALRWATRQAEMTGATLQVVTAWSFPEHPTPFGIVPELPLPPDQTAAAHRELDALVKDVVHGDLLARVVTEVVTGTAGSVLVERSTGADLLVVGSRGRGAVTELLLGSVSEHCVRHASCPVAVIRHRGSPS